MSEDRRVVTMAENEAEAELICSRLAEAGIHAVAQQAIGGPEWGASGSRYIHVAAVDLERAKTLLDVS
jgi:putative signal transducing protein